VQGNKDHSDPYLYPDVDWVECGAAQTYLQTINNLSLTGGNQTSNITPMWDILTAGAV